MGNLDAKVEMNYFLDVCHFFPSITHRSIIKKSFHYSRSWSMSRSL